MPWQFTNVTIDQIDALEGTNGTPSDTNPFVTNSDPRNTNPRSPMGHHTSHEPGGSDAMPIDAAAATGSLRTLGTAATAACAGNDSRLSDARTPITHAATHKSGGADAIKLDELAAPTDVTTLNASTSVHGLMQKYPGGTSTFLRADGAFAAPTAAAAFTQLTTDPVSPSTGQTWLYAPKPVSGQAVGMLAMTYTGSRPLYYDLSIYSAEATIIRVQVS